MMNIASNLTSAEPLVDVVDLDSEPEEDPLLQVHGKDTPTSSQSSSPLKKNNRRKSKLLIRNDDNITFESAVIDEDNEIKSQSDFDSKGATGKKKNAGKEAGPSTLQIKNESLEQMMAENPNFESMQRVAFLRACVNYMLKVKDLPIIDFNSMETVTLSKLVNTYNGITRIVPKNDEDIIGLSESDDDD